MKKSLIFLILFSCWNLLSAQQSIPTLDYPHKSIVGLVGDGTFLVETHPMAFKSIRGKNIEGRLRIAKKSSQATQFDDLTSSFFPGGVEYMDGDGTRVLYGVLPKYGFIVAVETQTEADILLQDEFVLPLKKQQRRNGGKYVTFFSEKQVSGPLTYAVLKENLYKPYREKLVINTPNQTLDMAVLFSQYLLDLGFNGEFMLCELFRWLDIWARDLGSGLLPGALASGRIDMARKSLEYDLRRYASMFPADCKNSNDPSQGGTAEGIGWTVRSIWNYYLYSGNKEQLSDDVSVMRPWIDFWITRDYDEDGLIIDVTEFMDHMIMMLTTNGVSTLAANAMYSGMLQYASRIEQELGNVDKAMYYQQLYQRTVNAINTVYWNEKKGYFNNMTLWGSISERSAQPSQSMLLKMGATDRERTNRTLDFLKKNNWNDFGSITILPEMNHVPLTNDQNVKIWPWWNLWEAEARFKNNDLKGGYRILSLAANTIKDEKFPGLMEETLALDGTTYGGNAFPTAAGNLIDVVVKDLMGIEVITPGWKEIRVIPKVPGSWTNYSCRMPIPGGYIKIIAKNGDISVYVEGKQVRKVYTTKEINVVGAEKFIWTFPQEMDISYSLVPKKEILPFKTGKYAQFFDSEFHVNPIEFIKDKIDIEGLARISHTDILYLIVPGNRLPIVTKNGISIRQELEKYVARGGNVIFYGASVNEKNNEDGAGILGEQCGIIDWEQYLPVREKKYLYDWRSTGNTPKYTFNYQATVEIPQNFEGKELFIEIGQIVGLDSIFVNGKFVASYTDMDQYMKQEYPTHTRYPHSHKYKRISRMYRFTPENMVYTAFKFGEKNKVEIRIMKDALHEGLTDKNHPNIGIETSRYAWQALDEDLPEIGFEVSKRKGVNYWGNEQFFNSWSTKQGLFGFAIDGRGIQFVNGTVLAGLPDIDMPVNTTYTDFALFAPLQFEVLAYTETHEHLLYPMDKERYPCIVRIIHGDDGGGYVLITPSVTNRVLGEEIIKRIVGKK